MKTYNPIHIKPEWKTQAEKHAKAERDKIKERNKGKLKESSEPEIRKDPRGYDINELSVLGENAVAEALKVEIQKGNGYDLIYKGIKVDVITQSMTMAISNQQSGVITPENYNPKQNCDVYVFCRAKPDEGSIWIGGWIARDLFYKIAKLINEGQKSACTTATYDGYRVRYIALKDLGELGRLKVR